MGIYKLVSQLLPPQFSIFQLMGLLEMDESNAREARNLLKQFATRGYVERIGQNMYKQIVSFAPEQE